MQVTHVNDHVTHAVIGGGKTVDFGISNSAEFFNILSSTLYKDQRLAVVRETICNANDAHIEAGITDTPIEITLTSELFTIRDFGSGIHKDDMGTIYGTYGNSTKKNDGNQTGGFGLGCKAPFAYTEHFDVHSMHDGVKTIYNLSKSSAAAQGKPGITPIASFPTKETGLMVSIAIKNLTDFHEFDRLVKSIVHNGDMNVRLNGLQLPTLGFTDETNFLITTEHNMIRPQTQIMVRYGHVIYPVDHHAKLSYAVQAIGKYLGRMQCSHYLVLQAKPHSIAVTPSRETLSMQDHTVNALLELMNDFLKQIETGFEEYCNEFLGINIAGAIKTRNVPALLSREAKYVTGVKSHATSPIRTNQQFAHRYMSSYYSQDVEFRKKDIKTRLIEMSKAGMMDRGLVQSYLRELDKATHLGNGWSGGTKTDWLARKIVAPIITDLLILKLDHTRLYVYDREDNNRGSYGSYDVPTVPAFRAKAKHIANVLPYLRKIVIITSTMREISHRASKHAVFKKWGDLQGVMLYHTSQRQKDKDAALAYFKASGMEVVDLTVRQDWEPVPVARTVVKKEKKEGWPALSSILKTDPKTNAVNIDFRYSKEEDAARVVAPEFVLSISMAAGQPTSYTSGWDHYSMRTIAKLWGDKGCITNSDAMQTKMLKLGAIPFSDWMQNMLLKHITTDPNMLGYWANRPQTLVAGTEVKEDMITRVYNNATLRKEFGITFALSKENEAILKLFFRYTSSVLSSYEARHPKEYQDAKAIIAAIKPAPEATAMVKKLASSPLLQLLDMDVFDAILANPKGTKAMKDNALTVFNLLIN